MNERIRKLFEQHTVPNFGYELDVTRNERDEYFNPILEDHWQTFQEAAELIVKECAELAKHHVMNISTYGDAEFVDEQIKEHFGVEE